MGKEIADDAPLVREPVADGIKSCLMCKHCDCSRGSEGYSEMTPGSDAVLECRERVMRHAGGNNLFREVYTRQQLREALATAETCPQYAYEPV